MPTFLRTMTINNSTKSPTAGEDTTAKEVQDKERMDTSKLRQIKRRNGWSEFTSQDAYQVRRMTTL